MTPTEADLLAAVLGTYESEYKDLNETWRLLETKAEIALSVAGVFIAGAFAFAEDLNSQTSDEVRVALTVALVLLVCAVGLAVITLSVRSVQDPLSGEQALSMVDDLLRIRTPNDFGDRYANFLRDKAVAWQLAIESLKLANDFKARRLALTQFVLVVAAVLVAGIVISSVAFR